MEEFEDKDITLRLIAKMLIRVGTLNDDKLNNIVKQNNIMVQKIAALGEKISAKQEADKKKLYTAVVRGVCGIQKDLETLNNNLIGLQGNLKTVDNSLNADIRRLENTIMNKLRGLGSGIASEISASTRKRLL